MEQALRISRNTMLTPRPKRLKRRAVPRRFNAAGFVAGALALILGATTSLSVHLVGEIPIAELFVPVLLPFLIVTRRKEIVKPTMRPLLILLGVWLAAQIVTDLYRQTRMTDWIRGDANIIFFAMDLIVFVALLSKNNTRLILYLFSYGLFKVLMTKFHPSPGMQGDAWKFGYAQGLVALVFLVSCFFYRRRNYAVMMLILLAFCAANVVFNDRSLVLFILIAITMTVPVIPERIGRLQLLPPEGTKARLFAVASMALCAGLVAFGIVEFATKSGLLGEEQQTKNERQSQSAGGILLGGRPEILVSSRAVLESPILGHGSWPKDPKYIEMLADVQARMGIKTDVGNDEERRAGVIPSHSSLMGAWVAAGVFGALFWFYLLSPLFKAMVRISIARTPLAPLYAYMLIDLLWSIFFSPFNGRQRLNDAFRIVIMIDILEAPMPVFAKKWVSRFNRAWNGKMNWRPSARI